VSASPTEPLHVAQIGFYQDSGARAPAELLRAWPSLVDVAEAAARGGIRVSVIQRCTHAQHLERNGVRYHFLPFGKTAASADLTSLSALLRALHARLLHVHGLVFPREVLSLTAQVPDIPTILQDHASRPPPLWRRALWRRSLAVVDGIAFCTAQQAQPFVRARVLAARAPVYAVPESTSRFSPGDRQTARRATGVSGEPAVLWVGHLDANKDPLTVLDGVSAAARVLPGLRLYCCFGVAPLLARVEARIAGDEHLRTCVQLLGRVPHEQIEQLMRAADIFVLGSYREGSGYSLIEALACGLPPVVTDIPSFRALTAGGAVGQLWPCGNSNALCAALRSVATAGGTAARQAVRAHFERELSFAALGAKLATMYRAVAARTHRRGLASSVCTAGSVQV
jgi:glycosyltransferase involved in cell wall biosynthesis